MANGADNVIEIRLVAVDEGVGKALGQLNQGLAQTEQGAARVRREFGAFSGGATGTVRAVRLLGIGILSELDPALASTALRLNQAAIGTRLLGGAMGGPLLIAIATAVVGVGLYLRNLNQVIERQAQFNIAIRALDTGPALARLRELSLELEKTRLAGQGVLTGLQGMGQLLTRAEFGRFGSSLLEGLLGSMVAGIPTFITGFIGALVQGLTQAAGPLAGVAKTIFGPILAFMEGLGENVSNMVQKFFEPFRKALKDLRDKDVREAIEAFEKARRPEAAAATATANAALAATMARIVAQEAELGEPIWLKLRMTEAERVRQEVERMRGALEALRQEEIRAAQATSAQQRQALIGRARGAIPDTRAGREALGREIARIDAELGPRLDAQIAQINAQVDRQIRQLDDRLFTETNRTFIKLATQATQAGFAVVGALDRAIRDASAQLDEDERVDFLLGLGPNLPDAAVRRIVHIQRQISERLREMRQRGVDVGTAPTGLEALLSGGAGLPVLAGGRFEQRIGEEVRFLQDLQDAVDAAFRRGGVAGRTEEQAVADIKKRAFELGMAITPAFEEGLREGVRTSRRIQGLQLLPPDLETTLKLRFEELKTRFKSLGLTFSDLVIRGRVERDTQREAEDEMDRIGTVLEVAIKTRLRALARQAEELGEDIPAAILVGIERAAREEGRTRLQLEGLEAPLRAEIARLQRIAQDPTRTLDEQATAGIQAALRRMRLELGTFGQNVEEAMRGVAETIGRGVGDLLFNVVTGQFEKLSDVWTNFWQGLARIATNTTQKLIERLVLEWILGQTRIQGLAGGFSLGGLFSFFGSIFGFGGGGGAAAGVADIAGLIPAFQRGGLVTRPSFALLGEAGPEAVIPLNRAGQALGAIGGTGMGGVTVINLMKEEELAAIVSQEIGRGREVVVVDVLENIRSNKTLRRGLQRFGR